MKVNAIRAMANIGPGSKPAIPALSKLLEMDDKFVPDACRACIGKNRPGGRAGTH